MERTASDGVKIGSDLETKKIIHKRDVIWQNVIIMAVLHAGAIYGLRLKLDSPNPYTFYFSKCIGVLSGLGVTAGAHRLWAHRTYKANTFLQIVLACMMSMTYQKSIYLWVRDHRVHHKFSETDADPHNAKRGFFFSHMGWLLVKKHPDVLKKGKSVDMSDLEASRIVMFQHKYYFWIVFFFAFALTTFVPVIFFGDNFTTSIFAGTIYRYIVTVHFTWCINSVAHLYGNKPYDRTIGPTENSFMKVFAYGEGYHNYHHTFPHDYKAAELGNDARNITTLLIDTFAWFGWATDRQTATPETIKNVIERKGDGSHSMYLDNTKNVLFVVLFMYAL